MLTIKQLIGYACKTEVVDETGDAHIREFIFSDYPSMCSEDDSFRDFLVKYLVWANGENWMEFLDKADE